MTYLDFGAGWKATHTMGLRQHGLDVTAHDFGRNFDAAVHDAFALNRQYDCVFASNVLNVHATARALDLTLTDICLATKADGCAIVNYPQSPRKGGFTVQDIENLLDAYFGKVERLQPLVWRCSEPRHSRATILHDFAAQAGGYTEEEMKGANIRPNGAVGRNPIVPRLVLEGAGCREELSGGQFQEPTPPRRQNYYTGYPYED